jgi:hypothetical protein
MPIKININYTCHLAELAAHFEDSYKTYFLNLIKLKMEILEQSPFSIVLNHKYKQ